MGYFSQFGGLPKQVYILGFLKTFAGVGSMTFAFSTLLMTDVLGLSVKTASLVMTILSIASAVGSFVGGKCADRFGRKRSFLFFAAVAFAMLIGASIYCRTVWVLPMLVMSTFCTNAGNPSINALIADFSTPENSVECFSFLYLCQNLGYSIGPSIGGMLFANHLPMTYFLQGSIFMTVALILTFTIGEVYDPSAYSSVRKSGGNDGGKGTFAMLRERKLLMIFCVATGLATICYQMVNFVLPQQMRELFGLAQSAKYTGNIWTVNGFSVVLLSPILIRLVVRKHHQMVNSCYTMAFYILGYSTYLWAKSPVLIFGAVLLWTTGEILLLSGSGSFIASQSPPSHRGRFQSLFEVSRSFGRGISSPLCAMVMGYAGFRGAWTVNICICAGVMGLLYYGYKKYVRTEVAK